MNAFLEFPMTTGESLRFDLSVPASACGVCRRDLDPGEPRLTAGAVRRVVDRHQYVATVCRPCMAERAPQALAVIEV